MNIVLKFMRKIVDNILLSLSTETMCFITDAAEL